MPTVAAGEVAVATGGAVDGEELALGRRFAEAMQVYGQGLPEPEIWQTYGHDRTTLGRHFRSGKVDMAGVLRLHAYYTRRSRAGFLDAVTGVPSLAHASWRAEQVDLSQVADPRYRTLIEASGTIGANCRELLERTGLLADSHIILLRDADALSIHIGTRTVVSPDLFGLDIRNRRNKSYAELVFSHVSASRAGNVLHQLDDDQGNGYRSLRLPFRNSPSSPLEVVTLPHAIRSTTNYLVR